MRKSTACPQEIPTLAPAVRVPGQAERSRAHCSRNVCYWKLDRPAAGSSSACKAGRAWFHALCRSARFASRARQAQESQCGQTQNPPERMSCSGVRTAEATKACGANLLRRCGTAMVDKAVRLPPTRILTLFFALKRKRQLRMRGQSRIFTN